MASTLTNATATTSILKPVMTLKGHGERIPSISYFPDGQRMISGSDDKTARQWDLKAGKEIEEARGACEAMIWEVAVSRDSRWVVTGSGDDNTRELKACEVETGIVTTFKGHSSWITCIDISADSKLLASGSYDYTVRIWNLETGKLVAGPFNNVHCQCWAGAIRFSTDSKKLATKSMVWKCLEVWDIQKQKLDVRIGPQGGFGGGSVTSVPIFWTNTNKNILAAFSFGTDDTDKTILIYVFDTSTLETVGTPFEGHTDIIGGLTLSFDGTILASASADNTIKLWAFESRQLLASFDVQNPRTLVLSPNSRKLAYTRHYEKTGDYKIYICDTPPDVLAQARTSACKKSTPSDVLNSDANRCPPVRHKPPIYVTAIVQRTSLTLDPQPPISFRLRKLLRFTSRTAAIPPVWNHIEPRGPLDFPATSPLPHPLSGRTTTQGRSDINSGENLDHCRLPDRLPPRPLPLLPAYTIYQPGGLFVQVMHCRLLSMSLSRRVNCATLQQVLPALTLNIFVMKTMFPLHLIPGRMEAIGIVSASSIVRCHPRIQCSIHVDTYVFVYLHVFSSLII